MARVKSAWPSLRQCARTTSKRHFILESSEPTTPQCESVFLGDQMGFVNIMVYNDADGTCELSMAELAAVCSGAMFQTCLDFSSLVKSRLAV